MLDSDNNTNESQEIETSQLAPPIDNSQQQAPAEQVELDTEWEPKRLILVGWDEKEAELACRALKRLELEQTQVEQQFESQRNVIQRTLATFDKDPRRIRSKVKASGRDFICSKYFKLVLDRADEIRQLILARQFHCMPRSRRRVHFKSATIATLIELLEDKAKRILTNLANLDFELDELSSARQLEFENASQIFMNHEQQMNSLYERRLRILNGDCELIRRELSIVDSPSSSVSCLEGDGDDDDNNNSLNESYFARYPPEISANLSAESDLAKRSHSAP